MEFVLRRRPARTSLALFPGAFNPPTRAHEAMALAALAHANEVVLTLAVRMPHKAIGADEIGARLEWMRLLAEADDRISVATTVGGLFFEMAREARAATGIKHIGIVCGRDAAERAARWDYGDAPSFAVQLEEFTMLVAPRMGPMEAGDALKTHIIELELDAPAQLVSSTEARRLIAAGAPEWKHLVPERIARRLAAG